MIPTPALSYSGNTITHTQTQGCTHTWMHTYTHTGTCIRYVRAHTPEATPFPTPGPVVSSAWDVLHALFWLSFSHFKFHLKCQLSQGHHFAPTRPYRRWLCGGVSTVIPLHYNVLFVAWSGPGNTEPSEGKGWVVFIHLCNCNTQHNVRHVADAPRMLTE